MFVYYRLYRKPVSPMKKTAIPGIKVLHEKARSVLQVCLLNECRPSLLANRYSISQPLLSQPQLAPHKHETEVGESSVSLALALTTSNSSESDSFSVCASIGAEETAARASQP